MLQTQKLTVAVLFFYTDLFLLLFYSQYLFLHRCKLSENILLLGWFGHCILYSLFYISTPTTRLLKESSWRHWTKLVYIFFWRSTLYQEIYNDQISSTDKNQYCGVSCVLNLLPSVEEVIPLNKGQAEEKNVCLRKPDPTYQNPLMLDFVTFS